MKLTRQEALFLYGILFSFNSNSLNNAQLSLLEDIEEKINNFLTRSETSQSELEVSSDDEDEDEDQKETPEHDEHLATQDLISLPEIDLVGHTEGVSTFCFEGADDDTASTVLDGDLIEESIQCIRRIDRKSFEVLHEDRWTTYRAKRLPKAWIDLLEEGVIYLVTDETAC